MRIRLRPFAVAFAVLFAGGCCMVCRRASKPVAKPVVEAPAEDPAVVASKPLGPLTEGQTAVEENSGNLGGVGAEVTPVQTGRRTTGYLVGPSTRPKSFAWVPIRNHAFLPGEKLTYDIKYQFVTAGQATLEVKSGGRVAGRETLRFESTAQTSPFFDKVFRVRDYNSSTADAETLYSLAFHQNLKEGRYEVQRTTTLDYATRTYRYERRRKGKVNTSTGTFEGAASDILSAFYYARLLPLRPGGSYSVRVFSDGTTYPLLVKVHPKIRRIKTPAGVFECLEVQPFVVGDAIFQAEGGRMTIFMTNDRRRLPVMIRSKVMVGSFDAELVKSELP